MDRQRVRVTLVSSCSSEDVTKVAELIAKYSILSTHGQHWQTIGVHHGKWEDSSSYKLLN